MDNRSQLSPFSAEETGLFRSHSPVRRSLHTDGNGNRWVIPTTRLSSAAETAGPAAVLFDLDGTLVDSERLWLEVVRARLDSAGRSASPALLAEFEGLTTSEAARRLIALTGESASGERMAEELETSAIEVFSGRLPWIAGASEALRSLREAGIPLGLVTSSSRRWVAAVERTVPLGRFDAVITADDVLRAKPHPEPYLRAAELLGAEPGACIVFEDSAVGATAATAAGCRLVHVAPDRRCDAGCSADHLPDLRPVTALWVRGLFAMDAALR